MASIVRSSLSTPSDENLIACFRRSQPRVSRPSRDRPAGPLHARPRLRPQSARFPAAAFRPIGRAASPQDSCACHALVVTSNEYGTCLRTHRPRADPSAGISRVFRHGGIAESKSRASQHDRHESALPTPVGKSQPRYEVSEARERDLSPGPRAFALKAGPRTSEDSQDPQLQRIGARFARSGGFLRRCTGACRSGACWAH